MVTRAGFFYLTLALFYFAVFLLAGCKTIESREERDLLEMHHEKIIETGKS